MTYKWWKKELKENPDSVYLDCLYHMKVYVDWMEKKIGDKEFCERYFWGRV